jgi:hypothetical protein
VQLRTPREVEVVDQTRFEAAAMDAAPAAFEMDPRTQDESEQSGEAKQS